MDSSQADTRERVDVVEGAEPAAAEQDTPKVPLSLKQRLVAIRDECSGISKDEIQMGTFKIKGHTFEAILSEIRPLLSKHGVGLLPSLSERTYSGNRCDVLVDFHFARTDDSEETVVLRWGGAGTDNGDKAFSKAGTNCVKEMLKKVFLVTDREDAKEAEESVEHQADDGVKREDLNKAREERRSAIQQWAGTFKSAVENARDAKAVDRLSADNRDQLNSEDLPPVTRAFIGELLAKRKAELA